MKTKLTDPLYTRDLAKILKISTDAARRKIKAVKEKTGYEMISIGNYLEHSKTSPLEFLCIDNQLLIFVFQYKIFRDVKYLS